MCRGPALSTAKLLGPQEEAVRPSAPGYADGLQWSGLEGFLEEAPQQNLKGREMKQTQGWMAGLDGGCEEARQAGAELGGARPPRAAALMALPPLPDPAKQGKQSRPLVPPPASRGGGGVSPGPLPELG